MEDPMFVPPLRDVGKDLPCWPNQSRLAVFLTRGLSVWLGQYAFYSVVVIFALIFLFGRQLDNFLWWVGYDSQFVSHFFFLRDQYSYWIGDKRYDQIGVEPFHMLEITIWLSLALWGTRFFETIRQTLHGNGPNGRWKGKNVYRIGIWYFCALCRYRITGVC
jgi:hypothetical protein